MSLGIDIDYVTAVLLADGWHEVANESFYIDAYEYVWEGRTTLGGGRCDLVASTGFGFEEVGGTLLYGPLTALLAVRCVKP